MPKHSFITIFAFFNYCIGSFVENLQGVELRFGLQERVVLLGCSGAGAVAGIIKSSYSRHGARIVVWWNELVSKYV